MKLTASSWPGPSVEPVVVGGAPGASSGRFFNSFAFHLLGHLLLALADLLHQVAASFGIFLVIDRGTSGGFVVPVERNRETDGCAAAFIASTMIPPPFDI